MGEARNRKEAGHYPDVTKSRYDYWKSLEIVRRVTNGGKATTPAEPLSKEVEKIVSSIVPDGKPVYLPYTNLDPLYQARFCQVNAQHRANTAGGERVDGWMIWEHLNYAEAEAHSVWRDPAGRLIDLTPRVDGEELVLFLPDPSARVIRDGAADRLLNTRTTIPGVPFTQGGLPRETAYQLYTYPPGGRAKLKELWGVDSAESH